MAKTPKWIKQWLEEWAEYWATVGGLPGTTVLSRAIDGKQFLTGKPGSSIPAGIESPSQVALMDHAMRELTEEGYELQIRTVRSVYLIGLEAAKCMLGRSSSSLYRDKTKGEELLMRKIKELRGHASKK